MDSSTRKQLTLISEALKRQKRNPKEKSTIDANSVISSEPKSAEKPGVFISKSYLITLLKNSKQDNFQVAETSTANSILVIFS